MGFSNAFSGSNGLVKKLANALGGTATIIYVTKGVYNAETDENNDTSRQVSVGWFPSPLKNTAGTSYPPSRGGFGMAGGLMKTSDEISGTIPYFDLKDEPEPKPNLDKIQILDYVYIIKSTEYVMVQNEIVGIAITADR